MIRTTINLIKNNPFDIIVDDVNDKIIASNIINHKIWEPAESRIIIKLLRNNKNVIDIGANIGYHTILFSKLVGDNGLVYSFEPEPNNFNILNSNITINQINNVVLENKAISDCNGNSLLYLSRFNKGDHRLSMTPERDTCLIEHITLDEYLSGIEKEIHFIKSDTQGHELKVLNGMKKIINKNINHLCCLMEFSPGLLNSDSKNGLDNFLGFFKLYPAEIYWIDQNINDKQKHLEKVDHDQLRNIAVNILENEPIDYSDNILIFFNTTSRKKYFYEVN